MSDSPKTLNNERLTIRELEKAAAASNDENRRTHLDQASIYATLGERARDQSLAARDEESSGRSWARVGTFAHAKRTAIVSALHDCDYNIAAAAATLEIGRSTIYRLLNEYCIEVPVGKIRPARAENGSNRRVIASQQPNVRSRLKFENGILVLVALSVEI